MKKIVRIAFSPLIVLLWIIGVFMTLVVGVLLFIEKGIEGLEEEFYIESLFRMMKDWIADGIIG